MNRTITILAAMALAACGDPSIGSNGNRILSLNDLEPDAGVQHDGMAPIDASITDGTPAVDVPVAPDAPPSIDAAVDATAPPRLDIDEPMPMPERARSCGFQICLAGQDAYRLNGHRGDPLFDVDLIQHVTFTSVPGTVSITVSLVGNFGDDDDIGSSMLVSIDGNPPCVGIPRTGGDFPVGRALCSLTRQTPGGTDGIDVLLHIPNGQSGWSIDSEQIYAILQ